MHFGTDKHFQMLVRNKETSLLELTVKGDFKVDNEKTKQKLNLHLAHKKSYTSASDIEWSLQVKNTEIENVRNKITAVLKRVDNTDAVVSEDLRFIYYIIIISREKNTIMKLFHSLFDFDYLLDPFIHFTDGIVFGKSQATSIRNIVDTILTVTMFTRGAAHL